MIYTIESYLCEVAMPVANAIKMKSVSPGLNSFQI